MVPTWGRGGRAVGGDGRVWAARGARSPAPPVHGAGGASVGSCEVRRWVRHSVRCWSHATEGSQTRHVAGSRSQQRLLRASASLTPTRRGAPAGGQGSGELGAPGCGPHGVGGVRARGRRPSASTQGTMCGPRKRPVTAAEPPRGPRSARSSARGSATRSAAGDAASFSRGVKKSATRKSRRLVRSGAHVGSSGAGATPTDRAEAPRPSSVHIALLPGPRGQPRGG